MVKGDVERRQSQDTCWTNSVREADELDVEHKGDRHQGEAVSLLDHPDGRRCHCYEYSVLSKRRPGLEPWFYHFMLFGLCDRRCYLASLLICFCIYEIGKITTLPHRVTVGI